MKKIITFPGQGSQKISMGKDLYDNFESAREVFKTVDEVLKIKLSQIIFEGPSEELTKTQHAQPALMAVSIALIKVLEKEFGKKINDLGNYLAGHSLGEYSALCAAGSLSLIDTARLLKIRGNAMAQCAKTNPGSMAAIIGAEINQVTQISLEASVDGEVCQLANDNSTGQIVISGTENGINNAIKIAKEMGIKKAIKLPVSGAFHSSLMSDAASKMKDALNSFTIKTPTLPVICNVTAKATTNCDEIKNLLIQQVTASVRWRETILEAKNLGVNEFIEIGSGKVLTGLVSRTYPDAKTYSITNLEDIKTYIEN